MLGVDSYRFLMLAPWGGSETITNTVHGLRLTIQACCGSKANQRAENPHLSSTFGNISFLAMFSQSPPCVVADFFYSYRGGELEKSHTRMLQSLLYQVLDQAGWLFDCFSDEYRTLEKQHGPNFDWPDMVLKQILRSLATHMASESFVLYLIVDALDESNEQDRASIIDTFRHISTISGSSCITKVLLASRPNVDIESVLERCHHMIKLQDENRADIDVFVSHFLKPIYKDLGFKEHEFLSAKEYIVKNSQGVFLWANFVVQELADKAKRGVAKREIRQVLKSLPLELSGIYERIIKELLDENDDQEIKKSERIFQLVLFAARPLNVAEFSQAMAVTIPTKTDTRIFSEENLDENLFLPTVKRPIISRGGNLVETSYRDKVDELFPRSLVHSVGETDRNDPGTVQLMHQSAREFLLRPDGYMKTTKRFDFCESTCHSVFAIISLRYLQMIAENPVKAWTKSSINKSLKVTSDKSVEVECSWSDEDFREYVQYLDGKRFFGYVLEYLTSHMEHIDSETESGRKAEELFCCLFDKMTNPSFKHIKSLFRDLFELHGTPPGRTAIIYDDTSFQRRLISVAAEANKVELVLVLLRTTLGRDTEPLSILQSLAELGGDQALRLFLDQDTGLNADAGDYNAALRVAAHRGNTVVAKLLLEVSANVNAAAEDGLTPLHLATINGHESVTRLLIYRGADVSAATKNGSTPLDLAMRNGHGSVVQILLDSGADINAATTGGLTLLHHATGNGNESLARLLINKGANVNAAAEDDSTPLHLATRNGHESMAQLLIDKGANVNAAAEDDSTPLHLATKNGHELVARLLLDKGANVSAAAEDDSTPLHLATENGHESVAQLLIDKGADISAVTWDGSTPLHLAGKNGHTEVARVLVRVGSTNVAALDGSTPLHLATKNGYKPVAQLLIDKGANIDAVDEEGLTPLDLAKHNGHSAVVQLLIAAGANVSAATVNGTDIL